jgi:hypothetical protein
MRWWFIKWLFWIRWWLMIIITSRIALKNRSMLIDTLKIRWFLSVLTIFINCREIFRKLLRNSLNIQLLSWLNVWWFSKKWNCYKNKCKNWCRDKCKNWCRYKCKNERNKRFDRCEFDRCDWWNWTKSFSFKCDIF